MQVFTDSRRFPCSLRWIPFPLGWLLIFVESENINHHVFIVFKIVGIKSKWKTTSVQQRCNICKQTNRIHLKSIAYWYQVRQGRKSLPLSINGRSTKKCFLLLSIFETLRTQVVFLREKANRWHLPCVTSGYWHWKLYALACLSESPESMSWYFEARCASSVLTWTLGLAKSFNSFLSQADCNLGHAEMYLCAPLFVPHSETLPEFCTHVSLPLLRVEAVPRTTNLSWDENTKYRINDATVNFIDQLDLISVHRRVTPATDHDFDAAAVWTCILL